MKLKDFVESDTYKQTSDNDYLSQFEEEKPSGIESFLRGAGQGLTVGTIDELTGTIAGAIDPNKTAEEARAESSSRYDAAQKAHPYISGAGNIVGSLIPTAVSAVGTVLSGGAAAPALGGTVASTAARIGGQTAAKQLGKTALKQAAKQALKSQIKRGVIEGAIGGVGYSDKLGRKGTTLGDIAKEATIGGVIGGAVPVAGNALSTITKPIAKTAGKFGGKSAKTLSDFVENSRMKNLGLSLDPSDVKGFQSREQLQKKAIDLFDELGLNASAKGTGEAYDILNNRLDDIIKGSKGKGVDANTIALDFVKNMENNISVDRSSPASQRAFKYTSNILNDLKANPTVENLSRLKREVQNNMGSIYKNIQNDTTLTEQKTIVKGLRDTLDKALSESVPESKETLSKMATLHKIKEDMIKDADKKVSFSPPFIKLGASTPSIEIPFIKRDAVKSKKDMILQMIAGKNKRLADRNKSVQNAIDAFKSSDLSSAKRRAVIQQILYANKGETRAHDEKEPYNEIPTVNHGEPYYKVLSEDGGTEVNVSQSELVDYINAGYRVIEEFEPVNGR